MMETPRSRAYIQRLITASALFVFFFGSYSASVIAQDKDESTEKAIELFNKGQDATKNAIMRSRSIFMARHCSSCRRSPRRSFNVRTPMLLSENCRMPSVLFDVRSS